MAVDVVLDGADALDHLAVTTTTSWSSTATCPAFTATTCAAAWPTAVHTRVLMLTAAEHREERVDGPEHRRR